MSNVQKILVPVDFSERSANGLKYATSLAREMRAEIVALHVFDKKETFSLLDSLATFEGWPIPPNGFARVPVDRLLREKALDLYNFVQNAVGNSAASRIKRRVAIGKPVKEVLKAAKEEKIDLIVLALQRKSVFSYLMGRGTSWKFILRFPCPVLLTPPNSKDWIGPTEPLVSWQI